MQTGPTDMWAFSFVRLNTFVQLNLRASTKRGYSLRHILFPGTQKSATEMDIQNVPE